MSWLHHHGERTSVDLPSDLQGRIDVGDMHQERNAYPEGDYLMNNKSSHLIAALVSFAVLASACSGGDEGSIGSVAPAPNPQSPAEPGSAAVSSGVAQKEELVIAIIGEPQGMRGELTFKEPNTVGLRNVIEQLTILDPESNQVSPLLATSWEQLEPTRWRFKLRDDVVFHDGSKFNAESAAFNVNWVWSPDNAFVIRSAMGTQITAVVVDEYTIDVLTEGADPLIPVRMGLTGFQSMVQIQRSPDEANEVPIGTGPYEFVEWVKGQYWLIQRFDGWWGHGNSDAPGQVAWNRVRFEVRAEGAVRAAMAASGEADIAMYITPEECEAADADPMRRCLRATSDFFYFGRLDLTGAHPALSDLRVREAISLAIDTEAIRTSIIGHASDPRGQLLAAAAVGNSSRLNNVGFDPDRARTLLAEARAAGVDVDGLNLFIASRQGTFPRSDEIVQAAGAMLTAVGIRNETAFEEPGVINPRIATRADDNQRAFLLFHPDGNPALDYRLTLGTWASCASRISVHCDPEFDTALFATDSLSGAARADALATLVEQAYNKFLYIPIGQVERAYSVPIDLVWETAIDQRVMVVQMSVQE